MVRMRSRVRCALLGAVAIGTIATVIPALAQEEHRTEYNIKAGTLAEALKTVSRISGKDVIFNADAVRDRKSPGLQGVFDADEAVRHLLAASGLEADYRRDVIIIRGRASASSEVAPRSAPGEEIVVTGSHIRGGVTASPVVVATKESIEKRGISDLGSFARSLVQNYSGGQNPGVAAGGQGGSENVTSSSTMNLRGLGADATLTLFNGHRVAYDAISQGVDISAVPLAAIDRVEVVTDGSSALYGSDAVGGVANVILRRDYDRTTVTGRIGGATDRGDFEQQFNAVTGRRWRTGGFMAAFDIRHASPITAGQRSYTQSNHPSDTLQAGLTQYSGVLAGHQALSENLRFELDGQFSKRDSGLCVNYTVTDGCLVSGSDIDVSTRSWTLSPSLIFAAPGNWEFRLGAVAGESKVKQHVNVAFDGVVELVQNGVYTNRIRSFEATAEGPLFLLPGGEARLALGGGVRQARFLIDVKTIQAGAASPYLDFGQKRTTTYGFGELSLPFVSPASDIRFIDRLNLTAALRYEDVGGVGDVATPKIGVVYAPSSDIALKFSWGKSFKAPTQYQTGQPRTGYSQIGSTFFSPPSPTPGTVLYLVGGNPELKPERATSWNATTSFTPSMIEGLRIDASYFHINYRDRAVSPIPQNGLAFLDIYSSYVTLNPTREQVLAALSQVNTLYDQGGGNPATADVAAIVTNFLQNAAVQKIEGVDLTTDYAFDIGSDDRIHLNAAGSYLKSEQQLSVTQPVVQLAGILYRQPHWRANSSIEWQRGGLSVTGVFTFIEGSLDNRRQPYARTGSYKTFDLIARYETGGDAGALSDMVFTLSALNILNEKPPYIRTISALGYHYDSNNFPSVGRFLSATISKSF